MKPTLWVIALLGVVYSDSVRALTVEEVGALRKSVIEMCRGGTTEGTSVRRQSVTHGQQITLQGLTRGQSFTTVLISEEQWQGIRALMVDPSRYTECVEHSVGILAPEITTVRNIDKDLNARLEYISSSVFCDNLTYVISQAPSKFAEWRRGAGSRTEQGTHWDIGPYIMGNPSAIGMSGELGLAMTKAQIYYSYSSGDYFFSEPLVVTSRHAADERTGQITKQIVDVINDQCFTFKRFGKIKKVRLVSTEPYRLSDGAYVWRLDKTGFLGASASSFSVIVSARDAPDYRVKWIDLAIGAPN